MTERLNNTHRSHFFWSDVFVLILKYSFRQFQMYLSDRYDHQQVHIGHWPACHVSSFLRVYCYPVISHCPTQPILQYIVYVLTDLICSLMELINFFETHFWELQEVNWKNINLAPSLSASFTRRCDVNLLEYTFFLADEM